MVTNTIELFQDVTEHKHHGDVPDEPLATVNACIGKYHAMEEVSDRVRIRNNGAIVRLTVLIASPPWDEGKRRRTAIERRRTADGGKFIAESTGGQGRNGVSLFKLLRKQIQLWRFLFGNWLLWEKRLVRHDWFATEHLSDGRDVR